MELTVVPSVLHLERFNKLVGVMSAANNDSGDVSLGARVHLEPLPVTVVSRAPPLHRVKAASVVTSAECIVAPRRRCGAPVIGHVQNIARVVEGL